MRIVVSIPVHENPEVVLDQVSNIKKYVPGVVIVLHTSEEFCDEFDAFACTQEDSYEEMYVNPTHLHVDWGDGTLMDVHISNFKYMCGLMDFDYFVLHASNDMYVKNGFQDYISEYDAGFQRHIIKEFSQWWPGNKALKDGQLYYIMNEVGGENIIASQVEGSFYKKDIFQKIIDTIDKSEFLRDYGLKYTREEIVFPTVADALVDEGKRGYPTVFSEVHTFDRKLWRTRHITWGIFHRSGLCKIVPRYLYDQFEKRNEERLVASNSWKIRPAVVRKIIKGNRSFIKKNMFLFDARTRYQLYDGHFYSVKRVKRDNSDKLRRYINSL
ncbi:MAG: hypothetical protein J6N21_12880 [Butyrivibrio sp.]|nr:hypothetical protein [Butyrivibrio sp.]